MILKIKVAEMLITGEVQKGDTLKIGSQHGKLKFEIAKATKNWKKSSSNRHLTLTVYRK